MKLNIQVFSSNLVKKDNSLWQPRKHNFKQTSYPDDGNDNCYDIEDHSFWFRHRNLCIAELIALFPPPGILLDIGGGNGYVSSYLNKRGIRTILLEPNPIGIINARKRNVKYCIQADFDEVKFKKNSLPAIGIFDVLEHIEKDRRLLQKLYDALIPGGKLYITVPAFNFLWSAQDNYAQHYRRYSMKHIIKLLNLFHFTVDYSTYFFSIFFMGILFLRSLPYRLGLSKKYTTEQFKKEMSIEFGVIDPFILSLFKWELNHIKAKKNIPIGSSIILVAHK